MTNAAFYVWIYYNLMIHLELDNMLPLMSDPIYHFLRGDVQIFPTFYDTIKLKFINSKLKTRVSC